MNDEIKQEIELNNVGYSLVLDNGQYKVLELTFDYSKGIIGTINVLSSETDRESAFERLKILIATNLI